MFYLYSIYKLAKPDEETIDLTPFTGVCRIFNDASFKRGGRFYKSIIQRLSGEIRKKLLIDGQPVAEPDFKSIHPRMLYDLEGLNFENLFEDPYKINGFERKLIKISMNIMINAENEIEAQQAIFQLMVKLLKTRKITKSYKIKDITEAIKTKHYRISHYFFTGIGLALQNYDSEIALQVMNHFKNKNEAIHCVHDSFIVRSELQNECETVMEKSYKEVLQQDSIPHSRAC